jgi:hypothetical protein
MQRWSASALTLPDLASCGAAEMLLNMKCICPAITHGILFRMARREIHYHDCERLAKLFLK